MKARITKIENNKVWLREINTKTNAKMGARHINYESMLKELELHTDDYYIMINNNRTIIEIGGVWAKVGDKLEVIEEENKFKII